MTIETDEVPLIRAAVCGECELPIYIGECCVFVRVDDDAMLIHWACQP